MMAYGPYFSNLNMKIFAIALAYIASTDSSSESTTTSLPTQDLNSTCDNGGVWHQELGHCKCPPGFNGKLCDEPYCEYNTCSGQGICTFNKTLKKAECTCNPGFLGWNCSVNCNSDPCKNSGICIEEKDQLFCNCTNGWGGEFCDHACTIDCQNGGTCYYDSKTDSATCKCTPQAFGPKCERSIKCYKCHTTVGQECIGSCYGAWCINKIYEDTNVIQKGCSIDDPYVEYGYTSPYCADIADMTEHGRFYHECSCGDQNWCNASSHLHYSIILIIMYPIIYALSFMLDKNN